MGYFHQPEAANILAALFDYKIDFITIEKIF
jgi:hypothetical protein